MKGASTSNWSITGSDAPIEFPGKTACEAHLRLFINDH